MKTIFLQRHAKSSWGNNNLPDAERTLNERGMKDAPRMGKRIANGDIQPDLIISSPALRAITTAEIIAKELNYKNEEILIDNDIYLIEPCELLDFVQALDDKYECVMIVGHNPGFTILTNKLSGTDIVNIPTAGVAKISFDINTWQDVFEGTGKLLEFDYPSQSSS